jgi:hypothetical protein
MIPVTNSGCGARWTSPPAPSFQPVDIVEVESALAIRKVLAGCQGRNSQLPHCGGVMCDSLEIGIRERIEGEGPRS